MKQTSFVILLKVYLICFLSIGFLNAVGYSPFQVTFQSLVPKFVLIILNYHKITIYQIGNIARELVKASSLVAELNTEGLFI